MSQKKQKIQLYFQDRKVQKLQDFSCDYFYPTDEEKQLWESIKKCLTESKFTIFCDYVAFDTVYNCTVKEHDIETFQTALTRISNSYPSETYILKPTLELMPIRSDELCVHYYY